jgi:SAM-dependent methyltransferase
VQDSRPLAEFSERVQQVRAVLAGKARRLAVYDRAMATIEPARIAAFQERHRSRLQDFDPIAREKFADIPFWIAKNTRLAIRLELDRPPRRTILDIGAGGGHFLAVCNALGHHGIGIDTEEPFYAGLCDVLGVARRVSPVLRRESLPDLGRRFDLVTVVAQKFDLIATHTDGSRTYWQADDWAFFLQDVIDNQLAPDGGFYLKLNKEIAAGEHVFNRAVLDWCRVMGGLVDDATGTIEFKHRSPEPVGRGLVRAE